MTYIFYFSLFISILFFYPITIHDNLLNLIPISISFIEYIYNYDFYFAFSDSSLFNFEHLSHK
jgi:hypothetical protein